MCLCLGLLPLFCLRAFETRGCAGHRNVHFNNAKINLCRKEEVMSPSSDAFQASVSRLTRKRLGKDGREQTATPWKRTRHGADRCGYSEKTQSRPHQGANAEPLTAARRSRPGLGAGRTGRVLCTLRPPAQVWAHGASALVLRCGAASGAFTHRTRRSGRWQGSRERRPRSGSLRGAGTKRCSLGSGKLLLPPWAPGGEARAGLRVSHARARTHTGRNRTAEVRAR